ncbi:divergent protein kinase domain 2B [Pelodytes ibericus]
MMKQYNGAPNSFSDSKLKTSYNFGKSFLGLDKCNACVGTSACKKFFKEEIRFPSWLAPHLQLPPDSLQNFLGNYTDDGESWRPVEISRLTSKYQHDQADKRICSSSSKKKTCSIEWVLRKTERFMKWMKANRLTPDLVQGLSPPFLHCPSQRLLDRIVRRYSEVTDAGSVYMTHLTDRDKLRLLYTLSVNIHPIVLQIFPGAEGWPFPKYFGSCGRLFVSTSTKPLTAYNNSTPEVAADLTYQLLQIIHHLSNNDLNYFFYFTHLDMTTFGTFSDGRLFIRDASKLGIIDKQQGKLRIAEKNEKRDIFSCLSSDCPPTILSCDTISERHNLVLVCKHLLPELMSGKFPPFAQQKIDKYVSDCANNFLSDRETWKLTDAVMQSISKWRTCDEQFAYRYPDCKYSMES